MDWGLHRGGGGGRVDDFHAFPVDFKRGMGSAQGRRRSRRRWRSEVEIKIKSTVIAENAFFGFEKHKIVWEPGNTRIFAIPGPTTAGGILREYDAGGSRVGPYIYIHI